MALLKKGEAVIFMTTNMHQNPVASLQGNVILKKDLGTALAHAGFMKIKTQTGYEFTALARQGWKRSKNDIRRMMKAWGYQAENYGDENVIFSSRHKRSK